MMRQILMPVALFTLLMTAALSVQAKGSQTSGERQKNKGDEKIVAAVRALLDAQVAAWNRGDIEGFMDGYARTAELAFVSGDRVTRGWQETLDRYKRSYDTREKMGQLAFTELEVTPLGKDAAVALGRWQLSRAGDNPRGRFTLILKRTEKGWRIIHDHTSSAG